MSEPRTPAQGDYDELVDKFSESTTALTDMRSTFERRSWREKVLIGIGVFISVTAIYIAITVYQGSTRGRQIKHQSDQQSQILARQTQFLNILLQDDAIIKSVAGPEAIAKGQAAQVAVLNHLLSCNADQIDVAIGRKKAITVPDCPSP